MFDLGWGKIIIIAVIALVVIGPKELPAVLRTVGQWMGKIRRMAAEFQGQFQEAMREAEMADLKKSIDAITDATRGIGSGFDPLSTVSKNIESAFEDKPATTPSTPAATTDPAGNAAATPTPTTEPSVAAEPPVTIEPPVPMEPAPTPPLAEAAAPEKAVTPAPTPPPASDAGGKAA
jgi:sec-independent protein translocase protein TatB